MRLDLTANFLIVLWTLPSKTSRINESKASYIMVESQAYSYSKFTLRIWFKGVLSTSATLSPTHI